MKKKRFVTLLFIALSIVCLWTLSGCDFGKSQGNEKTPTYTVTWKNEDGTILETDTEVEEGTEPCYDGETPVKEGTEDVEYVFSGWSPELDPITKNTTFIARFTQINKYTITWANADGTVLKTEKIASGKTPKYGEETPTREETAEYAYTFNKWSPNIYAVTKDETYTALYTKTKKSYTITWKNDNGNVLKTDTVKYGEKPTYNGSTPTKENNNSHYYYEFSGWSPVVENVTGDATYIAQFTEKPIEFSISYVLDGGINSSENPAKYTVESGEITLLQPTKYNYRFKGWTGTDLSEATLSVTIPADSTGNRTYTATWAVCVNHKYEDAYTCHDRTCTYCGVEAKATTEHEWDATTGACETCGYACIHTYKVGVCTVCGYAHTAHVYADEYTCHDRWCSICYYKNTATTNHDLDGTCLCKICKEYSHSYGEDNKCTRCQYEKQYTRDGDYIYFGSYPQSKVTDTQIATALSMASEDGNWISYKYYSSDSNDTDFMWYQDVEYNGEKYRGVYFTSYRLNDNRKGMSYYVFSYQDDNGYYTSTIYWFQYEPIKWRILEEKDGYATILAELILDSQDYYSKCRSDSFSHNGGTGYANNYALSNIRKWLNETFYNTAFTSLQQALIQTVTVDNGARSTNPDNNASYRNSGNNSYACSNTNDKVWLLSEQEVTKASYGFNTDTGDDTAREKIASDYAQCQGVYTITAIWDACYGKGYWWLRSPRCNVSGDARCVGSGGSANDYYYVNFAYFGVVPALKIRLS